MLNQSVLALGKKRSTIREIFEYGNLRAAQVGRENIFDWEPQCSCAGRGA